MATTNYTQAQAQFGFWGYYNEITNAARHAWQGSNTQWIGSMTGTDATMATTVAATNTPWYVSVDGGAFTHPASSGSAITLFSGLTDTAHQVIIMGDVTFAPNNGYTPTSGTLFSITGAAPALGYSTDTGPSYIITDPSFPGQSSLYITAAPGGNVRPLYSLTTNNTAPSGYSTSGAIRFRAQCDCIWLCTGLTEFWYSIDGGTVTRVTGITGPASRPSGYGTWKKVLSGLDNTAMHDYMIMPSTVNGSVADQKQALGIMIGGSSATFGSYTAKTVVGQFGDSVTESRVSAYVGSGATDVYKYSAALGYMPMACGKQGVGAATLNTDITTMSAYWPAVPKYAVLAIGYNDTAGATFRTNYLACINTLLGLGIKKILCRRIVTDNTGTFNSTIDADIQTVVSTLANPNVTYMGTTSWINISTVEGHAGNDNDGTNPSAVGTHPDRAGYITLVGYEQPIIQAFFADASGSMVPASFCGSFGNMGYV